MKELLIREIKRCRDGGGYIYIYVCVWIRMEKRETKKRKEEEEKKKTENINKKKNKKKWTRKRWWKGKKKRACSSDMQPFKGGLTSVATAVSERALRYDIDDFFLVKGSLRRRSFSASFSVPPYMATCVAISMSVLISVFINCKGTRLLSHFSLHAIPYCLLSYIVVCCLMVSSMGQG